MPDFLGDGDSGEPDPCGYVRSDPLHVTDKPPQFTLRTVKKPKSATPVRFRAVIDHHDGTGEKVLTAESLSYEVVEFDVVLTIRDGHIPADTTVTIQSSYTAADGTVTWNTQNVMQRPRGDRWKAYCESHTFCDQCGQVIRKGDQDAD